MKKFLTSASLLLVCSLQAQVYLFSESTTTYEELESPTSLTNLDLWDDPLLTINLGMDINFLGTTTNKLYLSDYGVGSFVTTTNTETGVHPVIDPFLADICDRLYNDDDAEDGISHISYKIEGSVGERICKIEWKNVGFLTEVDSLPQSESYANFQLWLHENSSQFDIVFGESQVTDWILDEDFISSVFVTAYDFDDDQVGGIAKILFGPLDDLVYTTLTEDLEADGFSTCPANGTKYSFGPTVNIDEEELNFSIIQKEDYLLLSDIENIKSDRYQLFDINGRMIETKTLKKEIGISQLTKGTYFLLVNTQQGRVYKKFVK
jgi:hypothetical protein